MHIDIVLAQPSNYDNLVDAVIYRGYVIIDNFSLYAGKIEQFLGNESKGRRKMVWSILQKFVIVILNY